MDYMGCRAALAMTTLTQQPQQILPISVLGQQRGQLALGQVATVDIGDFQLAA